LTLGRVGGKLYSVEESRKVLIVTDDEAHSQSLAHDIASVITPPMFENYSVSMIKADQFYGTDILPAHAFFLGCGVPSPMTFTYIEVLMERINFAGWPCGVFSSSPKALKYLSGIVRASEASMGKPLLAKNGEVDEARLCEWVKTILEDKGKR